VAIEEMQLKRGLDMAVGWVGNANYGQHPVCRQPLFGTISYRNSA